MIPLPPGCTVEYEIRIIVKLLTDEMGEWFDMIGGSATGTTYLDSRGREKISKQVQYGNAKPSYNMQNGAGTTLIRFNGADASAASMFLLKFMDQIESHNMKEYQEYVR
jgi:hypothetical protein